MAVPYSISCMIHITQYKTIQIPYTIHTYTTDLSTISTLQIMMSGAEEQRDVTIQKNYPIDNEISITDDENGNANSSPVECSSDHDAGNTIQVKTLKY